MPRVLLIINRFNIGGPVFNAAFLAKFLQPEFETLLVGGVPDEEEKDALYILEEYRIEAMVIDELKRNPNLSSDRKAYKKLKQIIEDFKPDIVHTHASKAGALGRKAALKCNVPVVLHTFHGHIFHSYFGKWKTSIYKNIERNLARKSTGIIAISESQKIELSETFKICSADKINVIPLGFDLEKFSQNTAENRIKIRKQYNIADEEIAIAIIGRLAPIKNHALFLQVIESILTNEDLPIKIFIVGNGSEWNPIQEEVERINLELGNKIVMTSWITDIAPFNAGMDIIALTSRNEGTPMSIIEAEATGVAVISTDAGGVKDVMVDGETGYIIPQGNAALYIEKLTSLIKNKEIREKMSQNGRIFVEDKFGYKVLIKNTAAYYTRLLNKNRYFGLDK